MTNVSFKVIRSGAKADKHRATIVSGLANRVAGLSLKLSMGDRQYTKYTINGQNITVRKFFTAILAKPGRTVSETLYDVMTEQGLNYDDQKLQQAIRQEINFLLANTDEGYVAVCAGLVGISPLGRKPVWYRNLTLTQQAAVPVRDGAAQEDEVGYDASVPAMIGPSYDGIRNGYVGVSGLGRRWISPSKVARIRNTDTSLKAVAADDAERRQQILALDVMLEEQKQKTAEATSALEALMSKNEEAIIRSAKSQALIEKVLETDAPIVVNQTVNARLDAMETTMREFFERITAAPAPKAKRARKSKATPAQA